MSHSFFSCWFSSVAEISSSEHMSFYFYRSPKTSNQWFFLIWKLKSAQKMAFWNSSLFHSSFALFSSTGIDVFFGSIDQNLENQFTVEKKYFFRKQKLSKKYMHVAPISTWPDWSMFLAQKCTQKVQQQEHFEQMITHRCEHAFQFAIMLHVIDTLIFLLLRSKQQHFVLKWCASSFRNKINSQKRNSTFFLFLEFFADETIVYDPLNTSKYYEERCVHF